MSGHAETVRAALPYARDSHHRLCDSRHGDACDCYALKSTQAHAALDALVAERDDFRRRLHQATAQRLNAEAEYNISETRARTAVAERDEARAALVECATIAGADTSGGVPPWPSVGTWAIAAARELRNDYADASDALHAVAERVVSLREALQRIAVNAESWHGPEGLKSGHAKALGVIAAWAREALAGGGRTGQETPNCLAAPFGGSPQCDFAQGHSGPHSWAGQDSGGGRLSASAVAEVGERYVVSDERLREIRAMFTDRDAQDAWRIKVTPGISRENLAGAIYDLLGERDDAALATETAEQSNQDRDVSGAGPGTRRRDVTPKMKQALMLLRDHGIDRDHQGNGVVSTDVSHLSSGQPWINFHTARALQRAGLARIDYSWDWPELELTEDGWLAAREQPGGKT